MMDKLIIVGNISLRLENYFKYKKKEFIKKSKKNTDDYQFFLIKRTNLFN